MMPTTASNLLFYCPAVTFIATRALSQALWVVATSVYSQGSLMKPSKVKMKREFFGCARVRIDKLVSFT
jgi:hypothetical protein